MAGPRYTIGIDLGTSNCAVCYCDLLEEIAQVRVLPIRQLAAPGSAVEQNVLPSFLYLGLPHEIEGNLLDPQLGRQGCGSSVEPVQNGRAHTPAYAVGAAAYAQTAFVPGRVISSAKSWLSHSAVDREAGILPWGSDEVAAGDKLSPVAASAAYLRHIRLLWDASMGAYHDAYRFDHQDITITVPASFDEAAQRLTLLAAEQAGYPKSARLLEEPQAAFYNWLDSHDLAGSLFAVRHTEPPHTVLVCDIGGGTTDFSLFEASPLAEGMPLIERVAVSDHILLGGDNIDLAIARRIEERLIGPAEEGRPQRRLSPRQFRHLVFASRELKERVLGEQEGKEAGDYHIAVPGEGGSLFARSLSTSIARDEMDSLVVEGFFPGCSSSCRPGKSQGALREWGLPYAEDGRVTCHLASFLAGRYVDAVLFNGGTLKPAFLRERLRKIIGGWQQGEEPVVFELEDPQLAVAKGAAVFGRLLRRSSRRIGAGYARAVYLELYRPDDEDEEVFPQLLCVVPKGYDGGEPLQPGRRFKLLVDEPVRFQLYYSASREGDRCGSLIRLDQADFHALPPLQAVLRLREDLAKPRDGLIEIGLEADLNELGMLQLFCVYSESGSEKQRWQLEFNLRRGVSDSPAESVRDAGGNPLELGVSAETLNQAYGRISFFYGKRQQVAGKESPKKLVRELEQVLRAERISWSIGLLRALWPPLAKGVTRRGRSLAHETAWLYLAGFVMRPGYGVQLDEWRMSQLWRCFELGLSFPRENSAQVQWWIMWRRVAGGLSGDQQQALFRKIAPQLSQKGGEDPEMFRLAGALERLGIEDKLRVGSALVKKISSGRQRGIEQYIWALGRLASRVPLYGSTHQVIPADDVASWFNTLEPLDWSKGDYPLLNGAFAQACRITGDRQRDLPADAAARVALKLQMSGAKPEQLRVLREFVSLDLEDQTRLFGEELPLGLRLAG